ncbi:MAG: cyclic nucleotide-binding domain-containing protein [Treponema sp.]|nr:cyclic nucleotide-binding domain-containing protein [Treponema sp.]
MAEQLQLSFVNFVKDAFIIVEGKRNADRFFILRSGKVRISKEVQIVAEEQSDILGPGDFFGVVSTMSGHSHIETAQALTDVTLISVHKDQFGQLIQNTAPVAMKIILQFSKRMRYLDEALTRLTLKKTAEADASHLFSVAEYYVKQSKYNQAYYAYSQYVKYCPLGENVTNARERMMKISPYVTSTGLNTNPNDMIRNYTTDSMIFCECEPGDELFIIQAGSVKIVKVVDNKEVLLAVLKIGDIFGEMALLESKPRAATTIAYEDCQLMAVNRNNFDQMIKTQPQLITRLTTLLAERIWLIYKQLANTLLEDPLGRMYDMLLVQLEKKRVDINTTHSFKYDFGTNELISMVGLTPGEGRSIINKLLTDKNLKILNDKISVTDVNGIAKQAAYFHKMQQIEKSRKAQ